MILGVGGPRPRVEAAGRKSETDPATVARVETVISGSVSRFEAEAAMRDILWLYLDLTGHEGFSGDHVTGEFDPWMWLRCTFEGGWGEEHEVRLLQEGSAVELISRLIDVWQQANGDGVARFDAALRAGRFDHLPAARKAIEDGLAGTDELRFDRSAVAVYEEYVIGLFARLAGATRPRPRPWSRLARRFTSG
jgi:hypothetical protein